MKTWNHVSIVKSNGLIQIFRNGLKVFYTVVSIYNEYPSNQGVFRLFGSAGKNELDGNLDDLRIDNIALSSIQVNNVMYGFKIANNIGFYKYDDTIWVMFQV